MVGNVVFGCHYARDSDCFYALHSPDYSESINTNHILSTPNYNFHRLFMK